VEELVRELKDGVQPSVIKRSRVVLLSGGRGKRGER